MAMGLRGQVGQLYIGWGLVLLVGVGVVSTFLWSKMHKPEPAVTKAAPEKVIPSAKVLQAQLQASSMASSLVSAGTSSKTVPPTVHKNSTPTQYRMAVTNAQVLQDRLQQK